MYKKLAQYYNKININKNYEEESNLIFNLCKKYKIKTNSLLDVGCGTGMHLQHLQNKFNNVVGVDISAEMIKIASLNLDKDTKLYNGVVNNVKEKDFDVIISLFNVINHIMTLNDLVQYFEDCGSKIKTGGIFIFDSFNGNEVLVDNPKKEIRNVDEFTVKINPTVDHLNSYFSMDNHISKNGKTILEYKLNHILWPLKIYKDLLKNNNFQILELKLGYKILIVAIKK